MENVPVVPNDLLPYTEGKHFISTKQVPSALLLRFSGSTSVKRNRDLLLRRGFHLEEKKKEGESVTRTFLSVEGMDGNPAPSSHGLLTLLSEAEDLAESVPASEGDSDDDGSATSGVEASEDAALEMEGATFTIRARKTSSFRMKYEDPWKIHAGRVLAEKMGKSPTLSVWSGDGIRLQDPLPPRVLGPAWEGSKKNLIRFESIAADEVKRNVIYRHTHWGKALTVMCNEANPNQGWARNLRSRINAFLSGRNDPLFTKKQLVETFSDHTELAKKRARSLRLYELLKTVDGIFTQRYLCYPEEVWTWDRFDLFTLGNISYLIGDEFLDRELTETGLSIQTAYAQLKGARKWFKRHSHSGTLEQALAGGETPPRWCMQFSNLWSRVGNCSGYRQTYLIGILSQTRGCGTPPPSVTLQSKMKFLRTVSTVKEPMAMPARQLLRAGLGEILVLVHDEAMTGLSTKSRITVTTSASWEKSRKDGGTTESIREMLNAVEAGEQIPVRDLSTGRVTTYIDMNTGHSIGELIFWSCLDQTLRTPLEKLRMAFLTVVKEPGKARSVTKARACLKIVLDLVNKLCSDVLKKAFRSSHSGMAKANHGWNLFIDQMSSEERNELFKLAHREENSYEGYVERTDTFEDLYHSSTDFEEATDQKRHEVARDLGDRWMQKCGIPPILRGIVIATCYKPRTVFFFASGVMNTVGQAAPEMGIGIRSVTLRQGVLMGDPLTKVTLHLTNVVARRVGSRMHDPDFYNRFHNAAQAYEAFCRGLDRESTPRQ